MPLIKWSPYIEPFLDFEGSLDSQLAHAFNPAVDMYEKDGIVTVKAALPGFKSNDVTINIEDHILTIEGSTEKKTEVDDKSYYRKEVRTGAFHRIINLPTSVDASKANAEFGEGILTVSLPVLKKAKPKSIPITIKSANK